MKENKSIFKWRDWARFEAVDPDGMVFQFADRPTFTNRWCPIEKSTYVPIGRWNQPDDSSKTLIERYPFESETAPAETDAPDLQARVEALEAHKIQSDADFKKLYSSVIDLVKQSRTDRATIEVLEAQVKELRESREMVHTTRSEFDGMRFVVPGAKSDVGVLSFTGGIGAPAEPDPTAQIAEIEQNERLLPIKQFPWVIEYKSTLIDPTAQKIEALKLLFPWRDGCNFMTVDAKFGMIWQWGNEPVNDSKVWASKGGDANARRVGHIPDPDPELCHILIKRNDGE